MRTLEGQLILHLIDFLHIVKDLSDVIYFLTTVNWQLQDKSNGSQDKQMKKFQEILGRGQQE